MTRAWSALALIFTLFGWLWISVNGKNVCEVKVPKRAGSLDEKDWIVRKVCCPGYIGFPGYCEPRCKPACVNAKCTAPQECTCNQGYETVGGMAYSTVGCQPKCNACRYGDCIAPNFCRCWPSFARRTLGQGCQPIAKLLLPAEQCLKKACSCWQEYFSWTPLLKVVPKCVRICEDDDHSSQSCLKPEKCVCNSLNQYLVCEGNDLPQQYACEAIKRVKTTVDGKDQTDREVQITKVDTRNSTDSTVGREEAQTPTTKIDGVDKKDQADLSVDAKEVRIAEVHPKNSTDSTIEREEVQTTTTKIDQASPSASTTKLDKVDKKDQSDLSDDTKDQGKEVRIAKEDPKNSTDSNVGRKDFQTTTNKIDSADKKDQADSSVDGKEVSIAEVDPKNSTDSTVEGEQVTATTKLDQAYLSASTVGKEKVQSSTRKEDADDLSVDGKKVMVAPKTTSDSIVGRDEVQTTTTKIDQANLSASTVEKEMAESATEKAQSEPVTLQTVKSDDDEELFPTYRTVEIFSTRGKTQTEYHMGWTHEAEQSDVMSVLEDVDPMGLGNDNWDIVRYQENLNQKDHPKRKHKSDRKALTDIPETTFPQFTNQLYSTHTTAQRPYSRTERRYSSGNTQKSEKSSSGVLIWPIVLGCLAVVLVVIAALFVALFLKTKAPVSIRARAM